MSTSRRLFDDPRNTDVVNGRAVGQSCCDGNAPYWDTYRIRDWEDAWASRDDERNMPAYKQSDPLQVQDDTGLSDNNVNIPEYDINGKTTGSNDKYKGMVLVEGPNSGYKPDFLSPTEWMAWQGVEFSANPRGVKLADGSYTTSLPNPPRWRRTRVREDKMRWGKGPGGWAAYGWTFLWCQKCETALEAAWSDTLEALPLIARGVAMVVSNIPVFGTAIAFVINAGVALAQDKPLDDAMLEAIGGALPGQPTSGMAFNAGVAIAKGKRVDEVFIASLPIPPEMKRVVQVAADVVYGIASGQNVTDVAYNEIRKQLPPDAQRVMDAARRIANGENVPDLILSEVERAVVNKVRAEAQSLIDAARSKGEAALASAKAQAQGLLNSYAAQTGYQIALAHLPVWQRDAITTGLAAGAASTPQFIGTFGSVPEKPAAKATNDTYYEKGKSIVALGAKYKGMRLADMLSGAKPFSVEVAQPDLLNGGWRNVLQTYSTKPGSKAAGDFLIDDAFRRGFLIATGLCEGMSERGPGQTAVYQSLAEKGGRAGFDAGQAVAHYRTLHGELNVLASVELKATSAASSILSALGPKLPPSTLKPGAGLPTMTVVPDASPAASPIAPVVRQAFVLPPVITPAVIAQKATDRAAWVDYYKKLG